MAITAGIGAAGSIAGGFLSSRAAGNAANAQVGASNAATDFQRSTFDATREDLNRFKYQGYNASNWLASLSGVDNGTGVGNGQNVLSSPLTRMQPGYNRYPNFQATPYQWQPQYQRMADYSPMSRNQVGPYQSINYRPLNPTMEDLERTPGYQFTLDQGLKAVTNANAAKGLAGSGAQGKGLADYAAGLASQTYQQQYQNNLTNFNTDLAARTGQYQLGLDSNLRQFTTDLAARAGQYQLGLDSRIKQYGTGLDSYLVQFDQAASSNRGDYRTGLDAWQSQFATGFNTNVQNQNNLWNKLTQLSGAGQNAAVQTGTIGQQAGGQIGANLIGAGNAQAAGAVGSANAWSGALGGLSNNVGSYFMLNNLLNPGGGAAAAPQYGPAVPSGFGGGFR